MNEVDEAALDNAIKNAVEFLNEAKTTDLAVLEPEQVRELMRVIVCRYLET
jgi:hypothetical protein